MAKYEFITLSLVNYFNLHFTIYQWKFQNLTVCEFFLEYVLPEVGQVLWPKHVGVTLIYDCGSKLEIN